MQQRKSSGPRPIQDEIKSFLRDSGLGWKQRDVQVFDAWERALEPRMRERAKPVRFRGGVLTVEVDSAGHMHEFKNFTGERYRKGANDVLGRALIRRLVFKLRG